MPAMSRRAWGCRSTGWWWRPMSTTSWRAPSRPAPTSCATWWRPPRRRWTSRSRRISSGCCSTPMAATPTAVRALMGSLAQSRRFAVSAHALRADARAVHRRSRRRAGERRHHPRLDARDRTIASIRTPPSALAVAEKETRDPSVPMVVLSTAHPAKFPDAVEAACGVTPALPDWLADLPQAAGARHRAAGRSGGGRTIRCVGVACGA